MENTNPQNINSENESPSGPPTPLPEQQPQAGNLAPQQPSVMPLSPPQVAINEQANPTSSTPLSGPAIASGGSGGALKKSRKLPMLLAAGVITLVMLGSGAFAYFQSTKDKNSSENDNHSSQEDAATPREVVLKFLEAFKAGDKATFDSLAHSKTQQPGTSAYDQCLADTTPVGKCSDILKLIDPALITDKFTDEVDDTTGDKAKVISISQEQEGENSKSKATYYVAVAEENGSYKVSGFGLSGIEASAQSSTSQ